MSGEHSGSYCSPHPTNCGDECDRDCYQTAVSSGLVLLRCILPRFRAMRAHVLRPRPDTDPLLGRNTPTTTYRPEA